MLDVTGRFKASWKNDDAIQSVISQLKGTGYKETWGDKYAGSPEFELKFTNGVSGSGRREIIITGIGLSIGDQSVSGLEPAEPVFEEINWQVKHVRIEAVKAD